MGYRLEPATLRRLWPKAPQDKIDSICEISSDVFDEFGIGDDQRIVAQLMANISHECGGGTILRESGNYRAERIVEVFGVGRSSAKVTPREAQMLAGHPEELFERVYNLPHSPKIAKDLGNHEPGDGYKFRGNGDLQNTGRGIHEWLTNLLGVNLVENPDLLAKDHKLSFRAACAEFKAKGCIRLAKEGNTRLIRRKINGGTNGMSEVEVWVRKWETALPDITEQAQIPRGADTGDKHLSNSTIIKGTAVTTVAASGEVLSQVSNVAQQASDTVDTVHTIGDNAGHVVNAVNTLHTFLGLAPQIWEGIGIGCGIVALGGCGYIAMRRYLKLRNEGV